MSQRRRLSWPGIVLGLLCLGGSWLVAAISWRLFEAPILRLKRFFPSGG